MAIKGGNAKKSKKKIIIIAAIASGFMSLLLFVIPVTLMVALPLSVVGSMVDQTSEVIEDTTSSVTDIVDRFQAAASLAGVYKDEIFANVKSFFGDSSEVEARRAAEQIIKIGGLNSAGDETEYGNTINATTSIAYEYFITEYNKYLKDFGISDEEDENDETPSDETESDSSDGTENEDQKNIVPKVLNYNTSADSKALATYNMGKTFADNFKDSIPVPETKVEVIEEAKPDDPSTPDIDESASEKKRTTSYEANVNVALTMEGEPFDNFFKPVFYAMAANSLGTQNKTWGASTEVTQADGTVVTVDNTKALITLINLLSKHSENAYTVTVKENPNLKYDVNSESDHAAAVSEFIATGTSTSTDTVDADGNIDTRIELDYIIEIKYRIVTKQGFIDDMVEDAYIEGHKDEKGYIFDKEKEKNTVIAQVETLAKFYGGELINLEEGEGIEDDGEPVEIGNSGFNNDGWGDVTVGLSTGVWHTGISNPDEVLAAIEVGSGPESGVVQNIKNIRNLIRNGTVSWSPDYCLKSIKQIYTASGFGYAGGNNAYKIKNNYPTYPGEPPISGAVVLTQSNHGMVGIQNGHTAIYFKSGGVGYVLGNEGGAFDIKTFSDWVASYSGYLGWTTFGNF